MSLTGNDNYFEDFEPGQAIRHARGKTMCEQDNVGITLMVLNTAEGHFNEDAMAKNAMGREGWNSRLQFGGKWFSRTAGVNRDRKKSGGTDSDHKSQISCIQIQFSIRHGSYMKHPT